MNYVLAAYCLVIALTITLRFVSLRRQLQIFLRRAPMTTGSFWFSGSFKLTESIQRQEFSILSYMLTILAASSGVLASISMTLGQASYSSTIVSLGLSLACSWFSWRTTLLSSSRRSTKSWIFVVVHTATSALAVLSLSR